MPNVDAALLKWVRNRDYSVPAINLGIQMGQCCIRVQIGQNLMYCDGRPYDPDHPDGVSAGLGQSHGRMKGFPSRTGGRAVPSARFARRLVMI